MGKTIDRAALHVLAALALYLFFVSAFGNIWLAAACALCALLLLRKLLSPLAGRLPKREARRGARRAEVERWAMLDSRTRRRRRRARCWKRPIRGRRRRRNCCSCRATRRGRRWT